MKIIRRTAARAIASRRSPPFSRLLPARRERCPHRSLYPACTGFHVPARRGAQRASGLRSKQSYASADDPAGCVVLHRLRRRGPVGFALRQIAFVPNAGAMWAYFVTLRVRSLRGTGRAMLAPTGVVRTGRPAPTVGAANGRPQAAEASPVKHFDDLRKTAFFRRDILAFAFFLWYILLATQLNNSANHKSDFTVW